MARSLWKTPMLAQMGLILCVSHMIPLACAQIVNPNLPPPPPEIEYEDPPEEDASFADQQYFFNPLQAKKEMDAGNFYYKKGNHRAAMFRYLEATKWDEFNPEAWYKLGEAYEKLEMYTEAREAWGKFIELSDDKGDIEDVQKKFAEWDAKSL